MRRLLPSFSLALGLAVASGCEPPRSGAPPEPPAPTPAAAPPGVVETPPAEMVREQARAGVGKRGGDLPAEPSPGAIITTPVDVYFRAQEQLVFNAQIPQAMQLFEASEGRPPQSEEEFLTRVIRENNIKLPELPAGHRYVYDVGQKQLMVEHPQ